MTSVCYKLCKYWTNACGHKTANSLVESTCEKGFSLAQAPIKGKYLKAQMHAIRLNERDKSTTLVCRYW